MIIKKLAKRLGFALAGMLIFSTVLAGCGKTETTDVAPKTSEVSSTAETKALDKTQELSEVDLIMYFPGTETPQTADVYAEAAKMIKASINANVAFKTIGWGDYDQKMKIIIGSGEDFDICFTAPWINNYHQNVAKGAYYAIDELLEVYAPKLKDSMPDAYWSAAKVNGKLYAIINQQIFARRNGYVIYKKVTDALGFDPKTVNKPEDLVPLFEAVKAKMPDKIPVEARYLWEYSTIYNGIEELVGTSIPGAVNFASDINVFNQFESEAFKNHCEMAREWYIKGYIEKDAGTKTDTSANRLAFKYAVLPDGAVKPGAEGEYKGNSDQDLYIQGIGERPLTTGGVIATMYAINSSSKNPERALMLLELLNTDEKLYNMLTYGFEGENYNKVGEKRIELIPDSGYTNLSWVLGNVFNSYLLPGQPEDLWEQTEKVNREAIPSKALGFVIDSEPLKEMIAQCQSVVEEYYLPLTTGAVDPDEMLPKFIEKLKNADVDKLIVEMQKQIDEWEKSK